MDNTSPSVSSTGRTGPTGLNRRAVHASCCALLGSAVVLGGLLAVQLGRDAVAPVQADLLSEGGGRTLLTTQTSSNEESLFVLDHGSATLLIYRADVQDDDLELLNSFSLDELFEQAGRRVGGRPGERDNDVPDAEAEGPDDDQDPGGNDEVDIER